MTDRERFESILRNTGRAGVEQVLFELAKIGFFTAPASTRFHGNEPGGLLRHSINVYEEAYLLRELQIKLRPELADRMTKESVAIIALLHDVCKAEIYKSTEKFRKDQNGKWEAYTGYTINHSDLPLGHGEKSIVRLLRWGLEITDDELLAIRWHMSAFDLAVHCSSAMGNYGAATEKTPLCSLLRAADELAANVLEA